MSPEGKLYVARYDFTECSKHGVISILNSEGVVEEELHVNDCPEITGLYFSKMQEDILYATETTSNSLLKI
jgi:hypothetical protein